MASDLLHTFRSRYPQYDDIPDDELAHALIEKYPVYKDTELLQDAMPVRAREFGEIKATDIVEDFKRDVLGGIGRVVTGPNRLASAAGVLTGILAPVGEVGRRIAVTHPGVAKTVLGPRADPEMAAEVAELLPGMGPKTMAGTPRLLGRGAAKRLAFAEAEHAAQFPKPKVKMPPTQAKTGLEPKPAWNEETAYPSPPEYPDYVPTPFDGPIPGANPKRARAVPPDTGEAGRITAGHLFLGGRAAAGALLGSEAGDSPYDQLRYAAMGAVLGAAANPRYAARVWQMTRPPASGIGPSELAKASAKWKSRAQQFFTPRDIARGLPHAVDLVEDAFGADDVTNLIRRWYSDRLDQAYHSIGYDMRRISTIHRAIDAGQTALLSPEDQLVAQEVVDVMSTLAQNAGIPVAQGAVLKDTFKSLRKGRPYAYGVYDLMADVRAVAKKITNDGGLGIDNATPVPSYIIRSRNYLRKMRLEGYPTEVIAYYRQYIEDFTKGQKSTARFFTPEVAERIKSVEFMRTIGLNVGSAVGNLLQQVNTFTQVSPGSFLAAYYDLLKHPQIAARAKDLGVISEVLTKADIDTFASATRWDAMLKSGTQKTGVLFAKVEQLNRLHAWAAGMREAAKRGLTDELAEEFAHRLVNNTQFRFGAENAVPLLRGGHPVASVIGQYKNYQLQQTLFLKNLIADDIADLAAGKLPSRTAKYIAAVTMLAGPDALTGHHAGDFLREIFAGALGGDPADYKFRGILGEIGISLGQQVGIGALPMENLQSLVFLLPGPALSHVLDTMSLVLDRDLSPSAMIRGEAGKALSPDQRAALLTRLGSVEADKIRRAVVAWRSQGDVYQQPATMTEAFGMAPPTGEATRPITHRNLEAIGTVAGLRSQAQEEYGVGRQEAGARVARWQELVRKKAEAISRQDTAEVERLNRLGVKEFGRVPSARKQSVKGARERQMFPAQERQLRRAPKDIRNQLREEVKD